VINPSQRPLPDNTQHSQQTNIHASGVIRTHDLSRRAAEDLRLRKRGHWDRQIDLISSINFSMISLFEYINIPASGCNYNLAEWWLFYPLLSWIFTFPLTDMWSRIITSGSQHAILRLPNHVWPESHFYLLVWEQALYLIHGPWRERLL
jgi:hypothetical protein